MATGPLVVFLTGLWMAGPKTYSVHTFLIAFPLLAAGLVMTMLILGEEAAARLEGRPAKSRKIPAVVALSVAMLGFPLGMFLDGTLPLIGVLGVLGGTGLVLALYTWPKEGPSENPLFVPLSVLVGGLCAFTLVMITVVASLISFDFGGSVNPVLITIGWIGGGLFCYFFLASAREGADRPMPKDRVKRGAAATALASLTCSLIASFLLP